MTANLLTTLEQCSAQSYSFFVAGKPETQGSKNAFGRVYTDREGRQRVAVAMTEQSKGLYAWRASVGRMAALAWWINRLAPGLYERQMLKRIARESP